MNLLTPPPDATVAPTAAIGAMFSDAGAGVDEASAHIYLDNKDVTQDAEITPTGVILKPRDPLADGVHSVAVTLSDKAGNAANRATWRFGVNVRVPAKVEFVEGEFRVSQQPYFPIGIYNGSCDPVGKGENVPKPFYQAADAGINCLLLSESTDLEALDLLLKHGMKGMKAVNAALTRMGEQDIEPMRAMAMATKDHPAMLAWWASDPETIEASRKNMAIGYRILREYDPGHPVIWVLSHADKYKESLATADACFTYMYPILQGSMTIGSLYDRGLKPAFEAAMPTGKQVWFATQAIDLRICEGERLESPDAFRPTPEEIRAMNYFVLTKGVKGLFFYAGGGSPTPGVYNDITEYPAQWAEILKIASELRYLGPVFATGRRMTTAKPTMESPAVHYAEWEHDGQTTVVAVNVGAMPLNVTWRFSTPLQPKVLFEDRVLSEAASEMRDRFKPFEVHVYRW